MKASLMVLLVLSLALISCKPPENQSKTTASQTPADNGLKARVELEREAMVGENTVSVYLLRNNEGVSDAKVEVTATMTHAGMAPVIAEAVEKEQGLYQTENFEFDMTGDWIVIADIKLEDGSEFSSEIPVSVSAE